MAKCNENVNKKKKTCAYQSLELEMNLVYDDPSIFSDLKANT